MPYSQIADISNTGKEPQRFITTRILSIVDEFSKDGELETFNAEVIKKIGKNTYWIIKAELLDSKNEKILELGKFLRTKGNIALNQIPAVNGYIIKLVGSPDDWRNLYIWLANEKGEKDSDAISLEFNQNFTLIY